MKNILAIKPTKYIGSCNGSKTALSAFKLIANMSARKISIQLKHTGVCTKVSL